MKTWREKSTKQYESQSMINKKKDDLMCLDMISKVLNTKTIAKLNGILIVQAMSKCFSNNIGHYSNNKSHCSNKDSNIVQNSSPSEINKIQWKTNLNLLKKILCEKVCTKPSNHAMKSLSRLPFLIEI